MYWPHGGASGGWLGKAHALALGVVLAASVPFSMRVVVMAVRWPSPRSGGIEFYGGVDFAYDEGTIRIECKGDKDIGRQAFPGRGRTLVAEDFARKTPLVFEEMF